MDQTTFFASVHDAVAHFYDHVYLRAHPLGRYLSSSGEPLAPDHLHHLLHEAIEQVQPAPGTPSTSPSWRRYQYLALRYLEGDSHEAVARRLNLSVRQAHRVRLEALDTVASSVWEKYGGTSSRHRSATTSVPGGPTSGDVPTLQMMFEDELRRLARDPRDAPADLIEELRSALDETRPLARRYGARVDVDVPPGPILVDVSRTLLRQAVVLLLSHALEWQADGRLFVSASTGTSEAIMEVFCAARAEFAAAGASGSASHLSMVRRLAEAQAGVFEVQRAQDKTCFRLVLPPHRVVTVLVVDDNPDLARLFELYLQGTHYRLIHAKTARRALQIADQGRPDVIVLDVMMPFQDGWEIYRQLQDNPATRTIPIVVCSILPEKELAFAKGAVDFLAKPVTAQSLIATLDRCLTARPRVSRGCP